MLGKKLQFTQLATNALVVFYQQNFGEFFGSAGSDKCVSSLQIYPFHIHAINNAKILLQLMSKSRSLAKISERKLLQGGRVTWHRVPSLFPCVPMDINILGGCKLKKRKIPSQAPSVTVIFSVHNNLKITSVIDLFIFSRLLWYR